MVLLFSVKDDKQKNNTKLENVFFEKLENLMMKLSHYIVKDGEGASKFITVQINEAKNDIEAKKLARTIINSPLIKTAMAGSDSNWGRIIMAIGKSGVEVSAKKI